MREKQEPIEESIKMIQKVLDEIDVNGIKYCELISLKIGEMIEKMKERGKELIEKVEELKNVEKKELMIQKGEMELILHGMKSTTEMTEMMIENGTNIELGMSKKQIIDRLNTLNSFPLSLEPIHDPIFNFDESKFDQILEMVNHCGEIIPKKRSVPIYRRDYNQISENQQPILRFGSEGDKDGQFSHPSGIATNSWGKIVVGDQGNHRIQIFDRDGHFLRKFGSEGEGDGQFSTLQGVIVDRRNDQIIVADSYNHRIQIFDSEGQFIRKFGSFGDGDGEFECPQAVAVNSNGNYFVTDFGNNRVQVFDSEGQFIRKFGSNGKGDGELDGPTGIGFLSNGNVVVCEFENNNRISIFDPQGNFIKTIRGEDLSEPNHLFVDSDDNILIANSGHNSIAIFSSETGNLFKSLQIDDSIGYPIGITKLMDGRIMISGSANKIAIY